MATENGTGINWSKVAMKDAHGCLDVESTMELVREELAAHAAEQVDVSEIASAVEKVFARLTNGGAIARATIDLAGLSARALSFLGDVPMTSTTQLTDRIKNYVRGESTRFVDSKGVEGSVWLSRGKLGGCKLATDAVRADYRDFLAKKAAKAAPAA